MKDILLVKNDIDDGTIDLTVGEPHVIRDSLLAHVDPQAFIVDHSNPAFWEYSKPNGFKPLVDFLEGKHSSKVIVTNGAKQGLAAYFYACKKSGRASVGMKLPYWALIPPLATTLGCKLTYCDADSFDSYDSYLLLAPNNPNGECDRPHRLAELTKNAKERGKLLAHDAAYYTHSYLPPELELLRVGDIQIYSASKMLGLSSLRIGYVVCDDDEIYAHMCEYMETFTVGVSSVSQSTFLNIMKLFADDPDLQRSFEKTSRESLEKAKSIILGVNPNVLSVPGDLLETPGMFGWFELRNGAALHAAKIRVLDGALFGAPGYVRLNLAHHEHVWDDVVERLRGF